MTGSRRSASEWPKLGFKGDYGLLAPGTGSQRSTVYAGASVTIRVHQADGFAPDRPRRREERQADTEPCENAARVEQGRCVARRSRSDGAREMLEAYTQATTEARKALELFRMRFGAGLTTSVDVGTAQGALQERRIERFAALRVVARKRAWARGRGCV